MMTTTDEELQEIAAYGALMTQIATLQARADALRANVLQRAATRVRALMAQHNLTEADVLVPVRPKKVYKPRDEHHPDGPLPTRYYNPANGKTWSGFGRAPQWITDAPDRAVYAVA